MTVEVSEGLLYFLKYPLLLLLYVFLATALRAMAQALPTPKELATHQASSGRRRLPTPPPRLTSEGKAESVASPEPSQDALKPATMVPGTSGREWLEVVAGMEAPAAGIPIRGPVIFGRLADCTVRIPDPFVSGHHARLTPGLEGATLEDLGSRNGTWWGEERLEGPVRLQDGDHFAVGDVTFRYHRT